MINLNLLFVVGLQSIPKEPLEAARLDGASGWRLFRHVVWPLLRPLTTVVVPPGMRYTIDRHGLGLLKAAENGGAR